MKRNQKGFSAVEVLLILVIVGLIGFVGWYVWGKRSTPPSVNSDAKVSTKTQDDLGTAPITLRKYNDVYCTTGVESDGSVYELFTDKSDNYVYKNVQAGIEFSYPKQWGAVMVDENNLPMCVGPMALAVGTKGQYGEGDGDLITSSTGYTKADGKYYTNWFKDSADGPYEIKKFNHDQLLEIPTANALALLMVSVCSDIRCSREVTINLSKDSYEGFGVSDRRLTNEDAKKILSESPDTSVEKIPKSPYSFQDIVDELKTFVKTILVSNQ